MADVKFVNYKPADVYVHGDNIVEIPHRLPPDEGGGDVIIYGFPQVYWSNGKAWDEANFWLATFYRAVIRGARELETIVGLAYCLRHYAEFLEREGLSWMAFPMIQSQRCIFQYLDELQGQVNKGLAAYSSSKARIKAAVRFYKGVLNYKLLSFSNDAFADLPLSIKVANSAGLVRSMDVSDEQLKLRGKTDIMGKVEDGLVPVSYDIQNMVINIAYDNCPAEVYLMLVLGFFTGMRLGTICDLKLLTFKYARLSEGKNFYYLKVGPSVKYAPVATKFGVNGEVPIPVHVYNMVQSYMKSTRRLLRSEKAVGEDKQLVLLNTNGRSYCRKGRGGSSTVNDQMSAIRKAALAQGVALDFKFHQTRATFGTNFVLENMDRPGVSLKSVLGALKGVLLHRNEKATMSYIHFVQNHKAKAKWADEFFRRSVELRTKW